MDWRLSNEGIQRRIFPPDNRWRTVHQRVVKGKVVLIEFWATCVLTARMQNFNGTSGFRACSRVDYEYLWNLKVERGEALFSDQALRNVKSRVLLALGLMVYCIADLAAA